MNVKTQKTVKVDIANNGKVLDTAQLTKNTWKNFAWKLVNIVELRNISGRNSLGQSLLNLLHNIVPRPIFCLCDNGWPNAMKIHKTLRMRLRFTFRRHIQNRYCIIKLWHTKMPTVCNDKKVNTFFKVNFAAIYCMFLLKEHNIQIQHEQMFCFEENWILPIRNVKD